MSLETIPFDVSEHLDGEEAISIYLSEALAAGDAAYLAHVLGRVAKARGMTRIASQAGPSSCQAPQPMLKSASGNQFDHRPQTK